MNISKRLRLCALILLSTAPLASSMHGMQRARTFVAQAARAVKNHGTHLKQIRPQTRLALAVGTVAATSMALLYAQRPLRFCTTVHAQGAPKTTIHTCPQQSEEIPAEEEARITKLIDRHIPEVMKKMSSVPVAEFDWLDGYVVKQNSDRIEGRKIFSDAIREHKLKKVTVPAKILYTIPSQHRTSPQYNTVGEEKFDGQHLVVAKKLEGQHVSFAKQPKEFSTKPINLEQIRDISTLLKHTKYKEWYYCDGSPYNLIHLTNGQIGFIDTELRGFRCSSYAIPLNDLLYLNMEPDAELFVKDEIKKKEDDDRNS